MIDDDALDFAVRVARMVVVNPDVDPRVAISSRVERADEGVTVSVSDPLLRWRSGHVTIPWEDAVRVSREILALARLHGDVT